jgi:hypothetical protein
LLCIARIEPVNIIAYAKLICMISAVSVIIVVIAVLAGIVITSVLAVLRNPLLVSAGIVPIQIVSRASLVRIRQAEACVILGVC